MPHENILHLYPSLKVQIVKSKGGFIVIDELTTSFGRTGKWFGYQLYPIIPDIVTMGKLSELASESSEN